jgi:3-oxo-5alpha-steroid 4-dehydrogenase
MLRQYAPEHLPGIPLGTIADDGSGILLGQSVGASTGMMHNVSQWRFINPPESFVRGILIDSEGNRICNEMLYGAQLSEQIMRRAGGQAWLLIDASLADKTLREIGPKRAMWFQSAAALMFLFMARRKASTLQQLAAKLHMPVENLQRTVNDYNALSENRAVLQQGPWYALDCRVDGAVRNPSITLGGLRVDEKTGQVLADTGGVIKGLYAAGRSAVGIASHSYVSGLSIAGCIFSGRRAGHHAGGQQKQA